MKKLATVVLGASLFVGSTPAYAEKEVDVLTKQEGFLTCGVVSKKEETIVKRFAEDLKYFNSEYNEAKTLNVSMTLGEVCYIAGCDVKHKMNHTDWYEFSDLLGGARRVNLALTSHGLDNFKICLPDGEKKKLRASEVKRLRAQAADLEKQRAAQ